MPTRIGTSDRPIDMLTLRLRILTGCASHAQTPNATNGQSPHRSPARRPHPGQVGEIKVGDHTHEAADREQATSARVLPGLDGRFGALDSCRAQKGRPFAVTREPSLRVSVCPPTA